jgi:hypothetical protein
MADIVSRRYGQTDRKQQCKKQRKLRMGDSFVLHNG